MQPENTRFMRKIEMVDLKGQYAKIKAEIDENLQTVIDSTSFINGTHVHSFCTNLAKYLAVDHVIPCANGTDALQIALMALDLQPGDEVITTPFTFVATAEVIALLKLKPVFVDIDEQTFNIDVQAIEKAITSKTRCIIPVHLFGQACHMEPILDMVKGKEIYIVEDNAQSVGANYHFSDGSSKFTGGIGAIGTLSFYPTKNLGGYGDGGAISVNDQLLADRIRKIANHGSDRKYYYDEIGVNSRLDSFQAAILDVKLKQLDKYNRNRTEAAARYDQLLAGIPGITLPHKAPYSTHVYHQYTIQVANNRDEMKSFLADRGIPSMIYYPVPLHISKAYAQFGYTSGDFPKAELLSKKVLSLPMHSELDEEQQAFIAQSIKEFMKINV